MHHDRISHRFAASEFYTFHGFSPLLLLPSPAKPWLAYLRSKKPPPRLNIQGLPITTLRISHMPLSVVSLTLSPRWDTVNAPLLLTFPCPWKCVRRWGNGREARVKVSFEFGMLSCIMTRFGFSDTSWYSLFFHFAPSTGRAVRVRITVISSKIAV
jgi:hypothetical protein